MDTIDDKLNYIVENCDKGGGGDFYKAIITKYSMGISTVSWSTSTCSCSVNLQWNVMNSKSVEIDFSSITNSGSNNINGLMISTDNGYSYGYQKTTPSDKKLLIDLSKSNSLSITIHSYWQPAETNSCTVNFSAIKFE